MVKDKIIPKHWELEKFENILDYIQPTPYIVGSTEYSDDYQTPVLTAGKSFVLGKTNEVKGIFNSLPVIIFDDFTTANKFVNFPFKVKSSAMKILKPKTELVNIKFVFYYMQTVRITFDTHKRYWISVFSKLTIPSPPLNEQLAIVSRIDELLSDLDNSKKQLLTAQQQLQVYRQSLLKAAFEGKLTNKNLKDRELPKGWKRAEMKEVTKKIQIGPFGTQLHKEDYIEKGIPLINPMHIQDGNIKADYSYSITREKRDSLPNYILLEGDIIMGRRGEMGRCGLVKKKESGWFCGTGSLYFRPNQTQLDSQFIFYYLNSQPVKKYLDENAGGTTMANLNLKIVNEIPIFLPSLLEQKQIVEELEGKLTVCNKLEETISQSLQQAESLRQSILKKAFEGNLVQTEIFTNKKRN
jgi:restriction endonuclease S subunit